MMQTCGNYDEITAYNHLVKVGLPDFLKSEAATLLWVNRGNNQWSRGIPGKVPYEVINWNGKGFAFPNGEPANRYWEHYGFSRYAPAIADPPATVN
jgi:hypothetical protein